MTKLMNNQGKIKFREKINEDLMLLESLDEIFKKKRGYIVKMPKEGSSVVSCFSGGQDSVANIGILLKEYKLNVYPFL